jgi:hypothetical protein
MTVTTTIVAELSEKITNAKWDTIKWFIALMIPTWVALFIAFKK